MTSNVIISWCRADDVEGNQARKAVLDAWADSKGFTPNKVIGYFKEQGQEKGSFEDSYEFVGLSEESYMELLHLAKRFKQDAVLYTSWLEICYLVDTTKDSLAGWKEEMIRLGEWTKVTEKEAMDNGAFTLSNNEYFIAK